MEIELENFVHELLELQRMGPGAGVAPAGDELGGENMQKVLCASHAAASFYSAKGLLQGQWWSRS